ncbi:MAG: hypothetical protein NZ580_00520 [Bacteroidia bacterium]|nr:hypothetical protein [Bacteroidia bacterium]MDW8234994.1 choice-of-anchor Q domain-containing protein [Bacteroidia bacterium]
MPFIPKRFPVGFTLLAFLALSCRREFLPPRPGLLRFSRDTVRFDSLFSTLLSPTQRLWIYNPHSHPVILRAAYLEQGSQSPFSFILDGKPGPIYNHELGSKDSLQVFFQLKDTTFIDATREDHLILETEAGRQTIALKATLIAAYIFRNFGLDSVVVSLPNDKPIVIDGFFYIGPQAVLRILPGSKLYFSARRWESGPLKGELSSGLYIAGRLEALGTPQAPISMQGWRLEPYYTQAAGQWQGIHFLVSSRDNRLLYTHISQSSIAIRIDSTGGSAFPKVYMEGCIIQRAANYGILALGFSPSLSSAPILEAVNTLVFRCGQACAALLGGGKYKLLHCSFIYDQGDLRRGQTAFLLTDFLRLSDRILTYPSELQALNCLFWSTKSEAIVEDLQSPSTAQRRYDYCALRHPRTFPGDSLLYLSDPKLGKADEGYPLQSESPLINRGKYEANFSISYDLRGRQRDAQPDIGVYEFVR